MLSNADKTCVEENFTSVTDTQLGPVWEKESVAARTSRQTSQQNGFPPQAAKFTTHHVSGKYGCRQTCQKLK